jgi:hypothetical protein
LSQATFLPPPVLFIALALVVAVDWTWEKLIQARFTLRMGFAFCVFYKIKQDFPTACYSPVAPINFRLSFFSFDR